MQLCCKSNKNNHSDDESGSQLQRIIFIQCQSMPKGAFVQRTLNQGAYYSLIIL